jgi:hypothetical protein
MPLFPCRLVGSMGMPPVDHRRRTCPGGNPAALAHGGSSFTRGASATLRRTLAHGWFGLRYIGLRGDSKQSPAASRVRQRHGLDDTLRTHSYPGTSQRQAGVLTCPAHY